MNLLLKDYSKDPIHISAIQNEVFLQLKDYFDSQNIIYAELSDSHNWASFLCEVRGDFKSFIDNECWEWVHQVADQEEES